MAAASSLFSEAAATCRMCNYNACDLQLLGCGCTFHAVSRELSEIRGEDKQYSWGMNRVVSYCSTELSIRHVLPYTIHSLRCGNKESRLYPWSRYCSSNKKEEERRNGGSLHFPGVSSIILLLHSRRTPSFSISSCSVWFWMVARAIVVIVVVDKYPSTRTHGNNVFPLFEVHKSAVWDVLLSALRSEKLPNGNRFRCILISVKIP